MCGALKVKLFTFCTVVMARPKEWHSPHLCYAPSSHTNLP